ncbi:helix-turn-helix domain-containing protein [Nocardiopsis akebiae]|uniref:helix-turn-helix domain-containing protein n=1 Tax=Nocardiopsis akebiae TaxID=2831968 RepID=UPI002016617A|nr:helix-turn-helix domain-containing protein [Nocardiopsis akebiae]
MQLRYSFRVYPDADRRGALAGAFGCSRVVRNDALRARETAHANAEALPTAGELSTRLTTQAKKTEERSWSGEVSSVVLQQSLRDLDAAYRAGGRLAPDRTVGKATFADFLDIRNPK